MQIGFIGFGNMAQALARGLAGTQAVRPEQIGACARDYDKLRRNTEPDGFRAFRDAAETVRFADMVIVAVKPGQVGPVVGPLREALRHKIVVSVAAGVTFEDYERMLAPGTQHLSTVPNTPVAVGEGIVVCERRHSLSEEAWRSVERLLSHVGLVLQVDTRCWASPGRSAAAVRPSRRCSSRRSPMRPSCTAFRVPTPTAWRAR